MLMRVTHSYLIQDQSLGLHIKSGSWIEIFNTRTQGAYRIGIIRSCPVYGGAVMMDVYVELYSKTPDEFPQTSGRISSVRVESEGLIIDVESDCSASNRALIHHRHLQVGPRSATPRLNTEITMAGDVRVNKEDCISCGLCVENLPAAFCFDDDGLAECYNLAGASEQDIQEQAIYACPVNCIHWA